jgi:hypothetical protein
VIALATALNLARRYWWLLAILGFSAVLGGLLYDRMQVRHERDQAITERNEALAKIETLQTQIMANENAAIERMADQTKIERAKNEVVAEIRKAPDAVPAAGGARVRLNCLRLKRSGQDTARIPACVGLAN